MENRLAKGVEYIGTCVSFFVHDGKGNFVMSKRGQNARDEQGRWDIGGGGIDFGKTVEETLRDEIKEEYCANVLAADFLGYRTIFREQNGKNTHWISFDFKVLVDPSTVKNGEPHKLDAVSWFTFEILPDNLHSQFSNFFNLHKEKLIDKI